MMVMTIIAVGVVDVHDDAIATAAVIAVIAAFAPP